jgi:hypothetical protein
VPAALAAQGSILRPEAAYPLPDDADLGAQPLAEPGLMW